MYHKRKQGQIPQKYRVSGGAHTRRAADGTRSRIEHGDEFHPTPHELESFSDKFAPVMIPVEVPVADIATAEIVEDDADEEVDETIDDEDEDDDEEVEDVPEFSSGPARALWVEKGQPSMEGVTKTGHGGTTYSKKDVEGVEG